MQHFDKVQENLQTALRITERTTNGGHIGGQSPLTVEQLRDLRAMLDGTGLKAQDESRMDDDIISEPAGEPPAEHPSPHERRAIHNRTQLHLHSLSLQGDRGSEDVAMCGFPGMEGCGPSTPVSSSDSSGGSVPDFEQPCSESVSAQTSFSSRSEAEIERIMVCIRQSADEYACSHQEDS